MEPEVQLTHADRAHLAALTTMPGYKIQHRLFRAEADKFIVALLNAEVHNREEVIGKHMLAKAAAMFYAMATQRVNEEVTQYTAAPKASDKPLDITERLIDLCNDLDIEVDANYRTNLPGEERG